MATTRVRRGVPVAYRDPDTDRDVLNPESGPLMLFHGHPGRITSAAVQHILVDWVGLEDDPASFAVGFCPGIVDGGWAGPVVPGSAEMSEGEYLLRKQRIEHGEPWTPASTSVKHCQPDGMSSLTEPGERFLPGELKGVFAMTVE